METSRWPLRNRDREGKHRVSEQGCKRAGVLQVGRELFPERGEGCWEAWEVSCGVRKEAHIGAAALGFGLLGRTQQGAGAVGAEVG